MGRLWGGDVASGRNVMTEQPGKGSAPGGRPKVGPSYVTTYF